VEAWFDYLSRCQYLLQEGRFHADILAYLGDEVPARMGRRTEFTPAIPPGYDFDGCDFQALMDAEVEDGEIVLPGGMRYHVLLLPDKRRMQVAEMERITQLARAGASIIAPALPEASPSLKEKGEGDQKVRELAGQHWPDLIHKATSDMEGILTGWGLPPDFSYQAPRQERILFIHRLVDDADIYFLSSQEPQRLNFEARFRQPAGRHVSLWDPATGRIQVPGTRARFDGGLSRIDLSLDPHGSVFVVFSDKILETEPSLEMTGEKTLDGPWILQFQDGQGALAEPLSLPGLLDWTEHEDFGVRHFSGTATYRTDLAMEQDALVAGQRILINLGEVREMAELIINGRHAGYLWKPPYRADITGFLKEGKNHLEVRVTNVWANRLIGDAHYPDEMEWRTFRIVRLPEKWPEWLINGEARPASERVAWTTRDGIYSKDDPLLPSGLLGPVKLIFAVEK
jgi:hypothetical protein